MAIHTPQCQCVTVSVTVNVHCYRVSVACT